MQFCKPAPSVFVDLSVLAPLARILNMKKILLLAILLISPVAADASTAIQLDETTALFTINFSFEDEDFVNKIPLLAKHGVLYNDRVNHIGYDIATLEEPSSSISSVTAIVLSDAQLDGSRYVVPTNTEKVFTLVILADFGEAIPQNKYQARITKLPYWWDDNRTTVHQNQLDDLAMPVLNVE